VPDFTHATISLSGLLLTGSRAPETPTANADEEIRTLLPAPPSTDRSFGRNVLIAWLAEVYWKGTERQELAVTTTIVAADGHEVMRRELPRADAQPPEGSDRIRVSNRTSLEGFLPGEYMLKIEARIAGSSDTVSRDARFRVTEG
jgi:hypothetical protein